MQVGALRLQLHRLGRVQHSRFRDRRGSWRFFPEFCAHQRPSEPDESAVRASDSAAVMSPLRASALARFICAWAKSGFRRRAIRNCEMLSASCSCARSTHPKKIVTLGVAGCELHNLFECCPRFDEIAALQRRQTLAIGRLGPGRSALRLGECEIYQAKPAITTDSTSPTTTRADGFIASLGSRLEEMI